MLHHDGWWKVRKIDSRSDEGIFLGYSCTSKSYKFCNLKLNKIVESISVRVDEEIPCKEEHEERENLSQQREE